MMGLRLVLKVIALVTYVSILEFAMLAGPLDPIEDRSTYFQAWTAKHDRLVGEGTNRLIVTGGSDVAFGIDSALLEGAQAARPSTSGFTRASVLSSC
jgi:hypothetical protein